MSDAMRSSSDLIIRTEAWAQATAFYESVLGLAITYRSENLIGFDTGAFCLYVEKGQEHGPVFESFVPDVEVARSKLLSAGPLWFRKMDRNRDGDVSRREFLGPLDQFDQLDTDHDGLIDAAEAARAVSKVKKTAAR